MAPPLWRGRTRARSCGFESHYSLAAAGGEIAVAALWVRSVRWVGDGIQVDIGFGAGYRTHLASRSVAIQIVLFTASILPDGYHPYGPAATRWLPLTRLGSWVPVGWTELFVPCWMVAGSLALLAMAFHDLGACWGSSATHRLCPAVARPPGAIPGGSAQSVEKRRRLVAPPEALVPLNSLSSSEGGGKLTVGGSPGAVSDTYCLDPN